MNTYIIYIRQGARNTTPNEWICYSKTAGCANKQVFAICYPYQLKRWLYVSVVLTTCFHYPQVAKQISYCRFKCKTFNRVFLGCCVLLWCEYFFNHCLCAWACCDTNVRHREVTVSSQRELQHAKIESCSLTYSTAQKRKGQKKLFQVQNKRHHFEI